MTYGKWLAIFLALTGGTVYGPQVQAYLDPVTGSMLIQGLIGVIAGTAVAIKLYWRRLTAWYARVVRKEPVPEDSSAATVSDTAAPEEE